MLSVLIGGALGAASRYLVGEWLQVATKGFKLPLAIIIVNIIGAFFLGLLSSLETQKLWLFLATGFCGGFTTFSTFSVESVQLLQRKQYTFFFLYLLFTIVGSIIGLTVGTLLGS